MRKELKSEGICETLYDNTSNVSNLLCKIGGFIYDVFELGKRKGTIVIQIRFFQDVLKWIDIQLRLHITKT